MVRDAGLEVIDVEGIAFTPLKGLHLERRHSAELFGVGDDGSATCFVRSLALRLE